MIFMSRQKLYIGMDIRDDYTQLAIFAPGQMEPDVWAAEEGEDSRIRTAVSIPGTEEQIEGFLEKIVHQEPVIAGGKECEPVNVLAAFLRKTLSLTKKKYPGEMIRRLVITTEYRDYRFISTVYRALEKLGIDKDRAMVVDRRQSYIYYVMSQRKELWVNQVGLFDFRKNALTYYQMQTDRFKRPALVRVTEKDYNDFAELLTGDENSDEEKASIFEGMVQGAIHGQIITTLYMTGEGFSSGFADGVMKKLCVGRHLFQGDNLYVCGACYLARENGGERKMEEFIYLDEDSVSSNISIQAYTDARAKEVLLAKAGTPWYQIDYELDVIPDGDEELELHIKNVVTREKTTHVIPMEGIPGRTDRKARVGIQIRFAGPDKCILTLRDKGFGTFFPSSYRIWEETVSL